MLYFKNKKVCVGDSEHYSARNLSVLGRKSNKTNEDGAEYAEVPSIIRI